MNAMNALDKLLDELLGTISNIQLSGAEADGLAAEDVPRTMLAKMDFGVQELCRIRALIAARCNVHAKINRLPEDILRLIFTLCGRARVQCVPQAAIVPHRFVMDLEEAMLDRRRPSQTLRLHPALPLSWTCSYWRKISLDHPSMWSHVDVSFCPRAIVQIVLERAQAYPLSVDCQDQPLTEDTLKTLLPMISLASDFSLRCQDSERRIATVLALPAPSLERFYIRASSNVFMLRMRTPDAILPSPLFAGVTPKLRHLVMDGIHMPFKAGFYLNLSSLSIRASGLQTSSVESHLCLVLRDSPALETLELSGPSRGSSSVTMFNYMTRGRQSIDIPSQPRKPCPRLVLRFLRKLTLELPVEDVYHLFSSISTEQITKLQITFAGSISEANAHIFVALFGSDLFPSGAMSGVTRLVADIKTQHVQRASLWATDTAHGTLDEGTHRYEWRVDWHDTLSGPTHQQILTQLCGQLLAHPDIGHITDVEIDSDHGQRGRQFSLLTRIPSLTSITFAGPVAPWLIHTLRNSSNSSGSVGCPELSALTIRESRLTRRSLCDLDEWFRSCEGPLRHLIFSYVVFEVPTCDAIEIVVKAFNEIAGLTVDWGQCTCTSCTDDGQVYRLHHITSERTRCDILDTYDRVVRTIDLS